VSTSEPTGQSGGASEHSAAADAQAEQSPAAAAHDEHAEQSPAAAAHDETVQASAPPPEDLRSAAGLGERPARRSKRTSAGRRRNVLITTAVLLLAVAVASLVYLGQQNRGRYYLVCGAEAITAAQGRGFPPWGQSALTGDAWRPVPAAASMPCTSQTLDSRAALARQLGEILVARVEAWVIGRRDGTERELLVSTQAQLAQVRLLLGEAGEPGDAAGTDAAGRALERLQGDLDYWSARDRVDAAMATLDEAAAQLDQAVAREPRHNGENATAWQRWLARIRQDLASGPHGAQRGAAQRGAPEDPNAPGFGPDAGATPGAPGADVGSSGPAEDALAPAGDAGVAIPDAAADPALPPAPGTAAPPAAPRKAPATAVPRGGQLI
jgi:hypothetical protein